MPFQRRSGDEGAVPVYVYRILLDQADIAVDAAAEYMLPSARGEICPPEVVHSHGHDIVPGPCVGRDAHAETGVASPVRPCEAAVDIYLGLLEHSVEFQEDVLAHIGLREVYRPAVPAVSGVEVAREEIGDAERMGQAYVLPFRVVVIHLLRSRVVSPQVGPPAVEVNKFAYAALCGAAAQAPAAQQQERSQYSVRFHYYLWLAFSGLKIHKN